MHTLSGKPIHLRCFQKRVPHHAHRVPTMIVAEDENDIRAHVIGLRGARYDTPADNEKKAVPQLK
jgi:hypothetical protein